MKALLITLFALTMTIACKDLNEGKQGFSNNIISDLILINGKEYSNKNQAKYKHLSIVVDEGTSTIYVKKYNRDAISGRIKAGANTQEFLCGRAKCLLGDLNDDKDRHANSLVITDRLNKIIIKRYRIFDKDNKKKKDENV